MDSTNRILAEAQLSSLVSRMLRPAAHETSARSEEKVFHIVDVRGVGQQGVRRTAGLSDSSSESYLYDEGEKVIKLHLMSNP